MKSTVTHIRPGVTLSTYCGAEPHETISLRHYQESLDANAAARGQIARFREPLCKECVKVITDVQN